MAGSGLKDNSGGGEDDFARRGHDALVLHLVRLITEESSNVELDDFLKEMRGTRDNSQQYVPDHFGFFIPRKSLKELTVAAEEAFGKDKIIAKAKANADYAGIFFKNELFDELEGMLKRASVEVGFPIVGKKEAEPKEKPKKKDKEKAETERKAEEEKQLIARAYETNPEAWKQWLKAVCNASETSSDKLNGLLERNAVPAANNSYKIVIDPTRATALRNAIRTWNAAVATLSESEQRMFSASLERDSFKEGDSNRIKTIDYLRFSASAGEVLKKVAVALSAKGHEYEPHGLPLDKLKGLLKGTMAHKFFDDYAGQDDIEPMWEESELAKRRRRASSEDIRFANGQEKMDIFNWLSPNQLAPHFLELAKEMQGMVSAIEVYQRAQNNGNFGEVMVRSYKVRELLQTENERLIKLMTHDRPQTRQEFSPMQPIVNWMAETIEALGPQVIKTEHQSYPATLAGKESYDYARTGGYRG